jgi:hypothetical protein
MLNQALHPRTEMVVKMTTATNDIDLIAKEHAYTLAWKQTAKGDWYVERMSVKADTIEDLAVQQDLILTLMLNTRTRLNMEVKG